MIPQPTPSFWARRLPALPVLVVAALVAVGSFVGTSATVGDEEAESTSSVDADDRAEESDGEVDDRTEPDESSGAGGSEDDDVAAGGDFPPGRGTAFAWIDSSAGPLPVSSISKTDEYPEGCSADAQSFGCTTSTEGSRIVVIVLGAAPGMTGQETMTALERDSFGDSEALDATIEEAGFDPLLPFNLQSAGDTLELAFAFLFTEETTSVTFTWPGNAPIELTF